MRKFSEYYNLQKKYDQIFTEIFDAYYSKGYFGEVSKSDIKLLQYKWFCKLVNTIELSEQTKLEPYLTNHNNKITREYYYKITGVNLKKTCKTDIIEFLRRQ